MMPLPSGPLLLDTSVYIRFIRKGANLWLARGEDTFRRSILTVIVAAELYAGTRSATEKHRIDELCFAHQSLGKLSFPKTESWLEAGILLGRYARVFGDLRMSYHFRDVLIALEATKNKATLLTENARDFHRWQKLLRSSGQNLIVFDSRKLD